MCFSDIVQLVKSRNFLFIGKLGLLEKTIETKEVL